MINIEQIQEDTRETRVLVQSLYDELHRPWHTSSHDDEVLTVNQAATLLQLTKATIYGMVYERRIPFHKPDGTSRLYFLYSEIMEWLKGGRKLTTDELDEQVRKLATTRIARRNKSTSRKGGRNSHE